MSEEPRADDPAADPSPEVVDPAVIGSLDGRLGTTPMKVKEIGFLLERLGRDCAPLQFVRELNQNAIEAILVAKKQGLRSGEITWDLDWQYREETGLFKLCCIDNGIGMTGDEMVHYINHLSSSAYVQSHQGNFGVGAKIAAATRNPAGVVYISWKDGRGYMTHLWRDPDTGEYGLRQWRRPDGSYGPYVEIADDAKPKEIDTHGTKVVLLGEAPDDDTMSPPEGAQVHESKWLPHYLNTRYFAIPDGIVIKARESWSSPDPEDYRANKRRTVTGQFDYLNQHAQSSGTVALTNATARWWILKDEPAINQNSSFIASNGHIALLYRDELYEAMVGRQAFFRLQQFGVIFGQTRVVIYIEPDEPKQRVETNTARTHLIVDGEAAPWHAWATEFREAMPVKIKELMEEVAAKGTDSDHTDSIRERLNLIRDLFKLSRYKPIHSGGVFVDPLATAPGGKPQTNGPREHTSERTTTRSGGGTRGNIYALHQASDGTPANPIPNFPDPHRTWISVREGTREAGDLEDRAARYHRDQNLLLINADFRVFIDMIARWERFYDGTPGATDVIRETVREWFEQALVETVLGVLSLKDAREWRPDHIDAALSEEALTSAVMQRYHVEVNVKRALGTKLGSLREKVGTS